MLTPRLSGRTLGVVMIWLFLITVMASAPSNEVAEGEIVLSEGDGILVVHGQRLALPVRFTGVGTEEIRVNGIVLWKWSHPHRDMGTLPGGVTCAFAEVCERVDRWEYYGIRDPFVLHQLQDIALMRRGLLRGQLIAYRRGGGLHSAPRDGANLLVKALDAGLQCADEPTEDRIVNYVLREVCDMRDPEEAVPE
jgi:hypothetical protein